MIQDKATQKALLVTSYIMRVYSLSVATSNEGMERLPT